MARTAALLAVLLGLAVAPPVQGTERIVGGSAAADSEFPWQAALLLDDDGDDTPEGLCGGTLIAARYVVTAAHCLDDGVLPGTSCAAVGVTDIRPFLTADGCSATGAVGWRSAVQHPDWPSQRDPDVAVIELDEPLTQLEQLRLPRPADAPLWTGGTTATVSGWGRTEDPPAPPSPDLLKVEVPIFSDADCDAAVEAVYQDQFSGFDFSTILCAGGYDGKDACFGDSGGPLMVDAGEGMALAGIVSGGLPNPPGSFNSCAANLPALYTRAGGNGVNAWIRQQVPQVEIDANPALPQPGDEVTLTAAGANPNGAYTGFAWDLDDDGLYDDAVGGSVKVSPSAGRHAYGVRATRLDADPTRGDLETRRIALDVRVRSFVAFAAAGLSVVEGQPATITVTKSGSGAGTAVATPATGTAAIGGVDVVAAAPLTLGFEANTATQSFTLPTVDDAVDEPDETFRVDLGGLTGELLAGSPTAVTVTVVDNDEPPPPTAKLTIAKRPRARGGRIRATVTTTAGGSIKALVRDRRGKTLGKAPVRRFSAAGRHVITLKLTKKARRQLKRRKKLAVTLVVTYSPGGERPSVIIKRKLTLRR